MTYLLVSQSMQALGFTLHYKNPQADADGRASPAGPHSDRQATRGNAREEGKGWEGGTVRSERRV